MRYHGNSRIVTVGGAYQEPMESSSFTGGNVLDWTPFVQSLPGTPGLSVLPTTASTRFNFNAMYAGSQPLWREFSPIYGDYHIDRWVRLFPAFVCMFVCLFVCLLFVVYLFVRGTF